jgi:trimethyllysine dioxygenase
LNHLTTTEIERFFRAIQNFSRIIHDPANELWLSLQEDEVIMFDNFRLLHGRSAVTGQRTLVTAYISKDDYQSKLALYGID